MPKGFRLVDADFDLAAPLAFDRGKMILAGFGFHGIARLKSGATIAQGDADLTRMVPIWMDSWSNGPGSNPHIYETWRITPMILPLQKQVIGNGSLPDLDLADYFAPGNWKELTGKDLDMGSASPVSFPYKRFNLLAGGIKEGVVYLMDGDSLGGKDHRTPLFVSLPLRER